jgi:NAD(P)-dependent dehydrogenase (short-subunit alcohol dehydrogenase family)
MTGTLKGKIALVTGASRGIGGRAIALLFSTAGADVVLTSFNPWLFS